MNSELVLEDIFETMLLERDRPNSSNLEKIKIFFLSHVLQQFAYLLAVEDFEKFASY